MDKEKIIKLLNKRRNICIDDPHEMNKHWNELESLFTGSEDEIIEFLKTLNTEQLEYASEVFDDIHAAFDYSQSFIDKLIKLQEKRPDAHLGLDYFGYEYKR